MEIDEDEVKCVIKKDEIFAKRKFYIVIKLMLRILISFGSGMADGIF